MGSFFSNDSKYNKTQQSTKITIRTYIGGGSGGDGGCDDGKVMVVVVVVVVGIHCVYLVIVLKEERGVKKNRCGI
jgi:hypothetical protein